MALASLASAQEKKTYERDAKEVFAAALSVAKANYAIESVDDKNEIVNIHALVVIDGPTPGL